MSLVPTPTDLVVPRIEILPRGAIYHLPAEQGRACCGVDISALPETLRQAIPVGELCPACRIVYERGR